MFSRWEIMAPNMPITILTTERPEQTQSRARSYHTKALKCMDPTTIFLGIDQLITIKASNMDSSKFGRLTRWHFQESILAILNSLMVSGTWTIGWGTTQCNLS
jgi:hypothetical protein